MTATRTPATGAAVVAATRPASAPGATGPSPTARRAEARLRQVLTVNGSTSLLCGLVGLLAAGWITDELGIAHAAWTAGLSAGLVAFGTVLVLATVDLTGAGVVVAVVLGLAVADLCALQLWYRARMGEAS